jgi:hypothetical protein
MTKFFSFQKLVTHQLKPKHYVLANQLYNFGSTVEKQAPNSSS